MATDVYVSSVRGSGGLDDGTSWANAYLTLDQAIGALAQDTDVWVDDDHVDTGGGAIFVSTTYTARIIVVTNAASEPPTDAQRVNAVPSSAKHHTNSALNMGAYVTNGGRLYIEGLGFGSDNTTRSLTLYPGSGGGELVLRKCHMVAGFFILGSYDNRIGGFNLEVEDSTFERSGTFQTTLFLIESQVRMRVRGGELQADSLNLTNGGFMRSGTGSFRGGTAILWEGVNFYPTGQTADWTNVPILDASNTGPIDLVLSRCKLPANMAYIDGSFVDRAGVRLRLHACDTGGGADWQTEKIYENRMILENSKIVYLVDGATNGSNSFSAKVRTSANTEWHNPARIPFPHFTANTDARQIEIAVYHGEGENLDDLDCWLEVSAPLTSGETLTSLVSGAAHFLATPTDHATDSSGTWSDVTEEIPSAQQRKQLVRSPSFTPETIGPMVVELCIARPSATLFVDMQAREV